MEHDADAPPQTCSVVDAFTGVQCKCTTGLRRSRVDREPDATPTALTALYHNWRTRCAVHTDRLRAIVAKHMPGHAVDVEDVAAPQA